MTYAPPVPSEMMNGRRARQAVHTRSPSGGQLAAEYPELATPTTRSRDPNRRWMRLRTTSLGVDGEPLGGGVPGKMLTGPLPVGPACICDSGNQPAHGRTRASCGDRSFATLATLAREVAMIRISHLSAPGAESWPGISRHK